jgi:hypothetical protein
MKWECTVVGKWPNNHAINIGRTHTVCFFGVYIRHGNIIVTRKLL